MTINLKNQMNIENMVRGNVDNNVKVNSDRETFYENTKTQMCFD